MSQLDYMNTVKQAVTQSLQKQQTGQVPYDYRIHSTGEFKAEMAKLLKSYGYAATSEEYSKGIQPSTQIFSSIMKQAAYNVQNRKSSAVYGSATYNPWSNVGKPHMNEAVSGYIEENGNVQNAEQLQSYLNTSFTCKGQYANTPEDAANKKSGLPPQKFQTTQKAAQELQSFYNDMGAQINNGTYSPMTVIQAMIKNPTLLNLQTAAMKNGGNAGNKQPDLEGLKQLGYDPQKGWTGAFDSVMQYSRRAYGTGSPISMGNFRMAEDRAEAARKAGNTLKDMNYSILVGDEAGLDKAYQAGKADMQNAGYDTDKILSDMQNRWKEARDPNINLNKDLKWQSSTDSSGKPGAITSYIQSKDKNTPNGYYSFVVIPPQQGTLGFAPVMKAQRYAVAFIPDPDDPRSAQFDQSKTVQYWYSPAEAAFAADLYAKRVGKGEAPGNEDKQKVHQLFLDTLPEDKRGQYEFAGTMLNIADTVADSSPLNVLQLAQSLYINTLNAGVNLVAGKPVTYTPNADWWDYSENWGAATGTKPLSRTLDEAGFLGQTANQILNAASDPLTWVGGGMIPVAERRALGLTGKALRSPEYSLAAEAKLAQNAKVPVMMPYSSTLDELEDFKWDKSGRTAASNTISGKGTYKIVTKKGNVELAFTDLNGATKSFGRFKNADEAKAFARNIGYNYSRLKPAYRPGGAGIAETGAGAAAMKPVSMIAPKPETFAPRDTIAPNKPIGTVTSPNGNTWNKYANKTPGSNETYFLTADGKGKIQKINGKFEYTKYDVKGNPIIQRADTLDQAILIADGEPVIGKDAGEIKTSAKEKLLEDSFESGLKNEPNKPPNVGEEAESGTDPIGDEFWNGFRGEKGGEIVNQDNISSLAKKYTDLVSSNKVWSWQRDMPNGVEISAKQRNMIKQEAIRQGLLPNIPMKGKTKFADFGEYIKTELSLPRDKWLLSDDNQFRWLDSQLPNGRPDGHIWNHSEIDGRMELVPYGIHNITSHDGGRSPGMWGYRPGGKR